jgi:iron(III) transport system substrate-binding protein
MRRAVVVFCCLFLAGCSHRASNQSVIVYSALDREFSEPILDDFGRETGIRPLAKFDIESTKTVGLTQALIAEADRPRCDVFWNNEILNTIRLERRGLLEGYAPADVLEMDDRWVSPNGTWYGVAARARVILVNTKLLAEADRPHSINDLADSKFKGKIGIAKPLFGTTATHAACLFAILGDDKARQYFRDIKANGVQILSGNKQVARSVASGEILFGLTDTDDAIGELEAGHEVAIIYPDSAPGEMGTLFIPNTLSILRGCPHPENAKRLVNYLLRPEVELRLAEGPSAQIPLFRIKPELQKRLRVETPWTIEMMSVDFYKAADQWDTAARFIRDEFTGS